MLKPWLFCSVGPVNCWSMLKHVTVEAGSVRPVTGCDQDRGRVSLAGCPRCVNDVSSGLCLSCTTNPSCASPSFASCCYCSWRAMFVHYHESRLARKEADKVLSGMGQVCLSLLGTWHGSHHSEKWDPKNANLWRILISIQGMILVEDPYFNEPVRLACHNLGTAL